MRLSQGWLGWPGLRTYGWHNHFTAAMNNIRPRRCNVTHKPLVGNQCPAEISMAADNFKLEDSPWVITVLHHTEAYFVLADHICKRNHQPFHKRLDHSEIRPSDTRRPINDKHYIGVVYILASCCKRRKKWQSEFICKVKKKRSR